MKGIQTDFIEPQAITPTDKKKKEIDRGFGLFPLWLARRRCFSLAAVGGCLWGLSFWHSLSLFAPFSCRFGVILPLFALFLFVVLAWSFSFPVPSLLLPVLLSPFCPDLG